MFQYGYASHGKLNFNNFAKFQKCSIILSNKCFSVKTRTLFNKKNWKPYSKILPNVVFILGCWYNSNFFILYQMRIHNATSYGPTSHFFVIFDMNIRKWSRIHLNLPRLNVGFLKFNVHRGILITFHHIEEFEGHKLIKTKVSSCRFQVG